MAENRNRGATSRQANRPKVADLFKIPEGLSPAWQHFFEKVRAYYEVQCATTARVLEALEGRARAMEEEGNMGEFEMLANAVELKERGNAAFKTGDLAQAFMLYASSMSAFPTPDTMNNMAACCLKLNVYDMVERYASEALAMDLFTNPLSSAKAHYRRAVGRLHTANFEGAIQDVLAAQQFNPSDKSFERLLGRLRSLRDNIRTPAQVSNYLRAQPMPTMWMDRSNIKDLKISQIRLPLDVQERMKTHSVPATY